MKLHQVLTGACNAGDQCFAVGSVEGIPFTAYASGSNIVILAVDFERVQIIPGICHNNVQISCLDCSTDTGKIAAAYGNHICVFEPTPLVHHNSLHKLDYRWVQTGEIKASFFVRSLSWNLEGTRLLLGGRLLQLWRYVFTPSLEFEAELIEKKSEVKRSVTFELGADADDDFEAEKEDKCTSPYIEPAKASKEKDSTSQGWELMWETIPAQSIRLLTFSPDGTLFATIGNHDTLVKVWYQDKPLLFPSKSAEHAAATSPCSAGDEVRFAFVYLAHPAPVISLEWRRTSKFMPKGGVANMLVTCSTDSISRLWVETVLPEDGLVNLSNFDPLAAQNPRFRTQRHKHKFMQRLKHMRHCFHLKRTLKQQPEDLQKTFTIPTMPSSYSVHDYHGYGIQGTGLTVGLHFHLAATINALTDIPLVPSLNGPDGSRKDFVVHWLNNKEMHFSLQTEYILRELSQKALNREESSLNGGHETEPNSHGGLDGVDSKTRATTGDLARFLRSNQEENFSPGDLSPKGSHAPYGGHALSNTVSMSSLATDISGTTGLGTPLGDALDHRIENLLKDWHQSADLLYAIHPLDGSFLVWLVDWMDEHNAGSFRQAQVSFSSRLPNAIPVTDASTLGVHLALFNPHHAFDLRHLLHLERTTPVPPKQKPGDENKGSDDESDKSEDESSKTEADSSASNAAEPLHPSPAPVVAMVTKHANGSLNLWHLALSDQSKFTQVLSVSHVTRISGHRFRVNHITCHPVLPLLLTTSHHNVVDNPQEREDIGGSFKKRRASGVANLGYCSELILWKVEPVGPLGKSGGVTELARINSPHMSAFASVAWIPTVLPSTILGGLSNSPSACFVASDGQSLRIYQAVLDARTLLAQLQLSPGQKAPSYLGGGSQDTGYSVKGSGLGWQGSFRIVSEQSTSRPGCILELDAIMDAQHDWNQTQFLHVFQQQLLIGKRQNEDACEDTVINGTPARPTVASGNLKRTPLSQIVASSRMSLIEASQSAVVDLQESLAFNEPFYIVVMEKNRPWEFNGSDSFAESTLDSSDSFEDLTVMHVWKLVISFNMKGDGDFASRRLLGHHVTLTTEKVSSQRLPLPPGVTVVHATPAAGHLSSASIYPACYAPYVLTTACTDNTVRFWSCHELLKDDVKLSFGKKASAESLRWAEWQMMSEKGNSSLSVQGSPLSVSAAYSGRIAVAYKQGKSFSAVKAKRETGDQRYVNLVVVIFECESTGGSEWVREDTIYLKNVHLPHLESVDPNVDLTYLQKSGMAWLKKREAGIDTLIKNLSHEDLIQIDNDTVVHECFQPNIQGLLAVPSYATLLTLKKSIEQRGNVCPLSQKHLVQLDWVSKEDGSHILTVAVGHKILLYTAVSNSSVVNMLETSKTSLRPHTALTKQSSTAATVSQDDVSVRWFRLRSIQLRTADGLPPLPMHLSWVRDGIFVVGMDNEMHIYCQWKEHVYHEGGTVSSTDTSEKSTLPTEEDDTDINSVGHSDDVGEDGDVLDRELHTLVQEAIPGRVPYVSSMAQLPRASSMHALAQAGHLSSIRKGNNKAADRKEKERKVIEEEKQAVTHLQDCLPSYGLFEASQIACPVLPQYHPRQLMELLNSGKIRWVKAILAHLVRCVSGGHKVDSDGPSDSSTDEEDHHEGPKNWYRTRTLSVSSPGDSNPVPITSVSTLAAVPEELTLDYAEISAVPPLPLWLLLNADQGSLESSSKDKTTDSLFNSSDSGLHDAEEDDLDAILSESPSDKKRRTRMKMAQQGSDQSLCKQYFYFGKRQARILTNILTHTQLPGLSSVDQMHLLALADTLASCDAGNLGESTSALGNSARHGPSKAKVSVQPGSETTLDPCGLRFLLALRHHMYLLRCLPPLQRAALQNQGISSAHLVWAFHSEAHEELLQLIPALNKANPTWAEYREVGIGWWLRNISTLRRCMEKLAKAAYQQNQDPLDAAIYYLAMKRKNIVWGLYRQQATDERMTQFFANNFAEERWRKAALKNAYALLGKQRLQQAVAFFLLAGSLKDAIDICVTRMRDIQLAIVICRLYEGDVELVPQSLKTLLHGHVIGVENVDTEHTGNVNAWVDPFFRSMAYWILGQYSESLETLLERRSSSSKEGIQSVTIASPSVFNFYIYLRNHPLIIRQQLASTVESGNARKRQHLAGVGAISIDKNYLLRESITPLERRLYFTTAHSHLLAGCPALALEVLSKLPEHVSQVVAEADTSTSQQSATTDNQQATDNSFDWSVPVSKTEAQADAFDWSVPMSKTEVQADTFDWSQPVQQKEDKLELAWSDDSDEESDASSQCGLTMKTEVKEPETKAAAEEAAEAEEETGGIDIMAQQLKFIACLKILMGEMATLATGFEVDGGQLRLQLYVWLEKELQALKQLCNYAPGSVDGSEEEEPSLLPVSPPAHAIITNERLSLHEVMAAEKLDFEAKVKRATLRKRWLKVNELLLRTLLSYCSVHGSQGGGLASVRMELIILLQELQQDRKMSLTASESASQLPQQHLVTPLPFPTNLPLLAACIAGTKVITTDPVRHLQSQIRDILQTIVGLREVPVPGRVSFAQMSLLRDLALGLSACLYQCLCTSDAWSLHQKEQERGSANPLARLAVVFRAIHTISGIKDYTNAEDANLKPTSSPSKWPGVSSLRALLAREKDDDSPRLLTLLGEAFVAVYVSLLSYALAASDAHVLFRLAGLQPSEEMWGVCFGGGTKQTVRVAAASSPLQQIASPEVSGAGQSAATTAVDVSKQRVRLHMKLLQQGGGPAAVGGGLASGSPQISGSTPGGRKMSTTSGEDLPTYKEVFVAPKSSIVAYLMKKPSLSSDIADYDSSASDSEDDYDEDSEDEDDGHFEDDRKSTRGPLASYKPKANTEHTDPSSISWCAIRLAATRLAFVHIEEFFRVVSIEPQDLPVMSPLSHSVQRTLQQWSGWLQKQLNAAGPVHSDYIPGCVVDSSVTGPPIQKYRGLLDPANTPFSATKAARPLQRLWTFLVRQEEVQDIFIRLVFKKRRTGPPARTNVRGSVAGDSVSVYSDSATHVDDLTDSMTAVSGGGAERLQDPVRIIHKDQDIISAFCINSTNMGIMALSNGKEIQELDVTPLLEDAPSFAEDECELDLIGLDKDLDTMSSPSYLVVQVPGDRSTLSQLNQSGSGLTSSASHVHFPSYAPAAAHSSVPPGGPVLPVTGRGTTLLRKHKVEGARRMAAHPTLPLYMSGENDGSVCVWEWGHVGIVSQPRPAGTYAKVNRLRFNCHGNKFGVADADGHLALWTLRLGGGAQTHRPFFSVQCHNKGTSDFVFLGSSSVVATAGHSSESKNVALWDTLMPQRKALMHGFTCHENGSTSIVYAPQHQVLISAGRKGDVCIWDVRQRTLRHKFTAHESSVAVKCMALDPNEEFFVTGSADGDIKVWSLATQHILFAFPAEHSRSSFFRSMSQGNGVSQLHVDGQGRMFSCGADGSMKLRQLPLVGREAVVSSLY